jgi:hypothetical protein
MFDTSDVVCWKWARTWISALLSATENSILKFLTVSSVSSDSIVKGIIDDIIKTGAITSKFRNWN